MENKSSVHSKINETVKNTLDGFEERYSTADWVKIELALEDSPPSSINPLGKINFSNLFENLPKFNFLKNVSSSYLIVGSAVVIGAVVLLFSIFSVSQKTDDTETDKAISPAEEVVTPSPVQTISEQPIHKDTIETIRNPKAEESAQTNRQFNKKVGESKDGQQVEEIGLTEPKPTTTVVKRKRAVDTNQADSGNPTIVIPENTPPQETNPAQTDASKVQEQVANQPTTDTTARHQETKKVKEKRKQKKQPVASDTVPHPTTLKELGTGQ